MIYAQVRTPPGRFYFAERLGGPPPGERAVVEAPWEGADMTEADADDSPPAKEIILEACCDSRESVRNAVKGGALRVEICARASLHVGGLTPSPSLVRAALAEAPDVVALVRIRSGDFVYTEEELRDMVSEVRELRAVGCRGFALGCLGADQCINQIVATRLAAAQS